MSHSNLQAGTLIEPFNAFLPELNKYSPCARLLEKYSYELNQFLSLLAFILSGLQRLL
jgi:hypothetical protein